MESLDTRNSSLASNVQYSLNRKFYGLCKAKKVIWCTHQSNLVAFHDLAKPSDTYDDYFTGTQFPTGTANSIEPSS